MISLQQGREIWKRRDTIRWIDLTELFKMESDTKNIFMFEIFCFLKSAIITGANKTKKTFFECYSEFSEVKRIKELSFALIATKKLILFSFLLLSFFKKWFSRNEAPTCNGSRKPIKNETNFLFLQKISLFLWKIF